MVDAEKRKCSIAFKVAPFIVVSLLLATSISKGDIVLVPFSDSRKDGQVIDAYLGEGECESLRVRRGMIFLWYENVPADADVKNDARTEHVSIP